MHILAAIVAISALIVAGIVFVSLPPPSERLTLTVYTDESFIKWGKYPKTIDSRAFGEFEERYNVNVSIQRLQTDAAGIITRLGAESANPVADAVIGIDNTLILEPGVTDLLTPYEPPNLNVVNESFIDYLDPDHYVTPYDFGLVTLIYNKTTMDPATYPQLNTLTFENLSDPTFAGALVTENPHLSSPGLAFLLTEIAVHEKLLNENWTQWWIDVNEYIDVESGWTEAWTTWTDDPTKHILNSYGTDGAFSAYTYGGEPDTGIAPIYHNGTHYAWMQVEGMGLVKNGPNPELAKLFIEYCLNETVQSLIATNNWMFPVRNHVTLDPVYVHALHPRDVSLLNELLPRSEIAANLDEWLDTFDEIRTP
ncbi:MAG: thiamine ABC transporter substrate-binding protein [Candidatus Thorarchaeota archaeon]